MEKYVFCPFMPPTQEGFKNVAKTIEERTEKWSEEREKKGKKGYKFVCWTGKGKPPYIVSFYEGIGVRELTKKPTVDPADPKQRKGLTTFRPVTPDGTGKITLMDDDQVYIKGHHSPGEGFISDITKQEEDESKGKENFTAIKLKPEDLASRFFDCFQAQMLWTGKIKFYNCNSGVNYGASFAKPAADRLRACWPIATYIGYSQPVSQEYYNYKVPEKDLPDQEVRSLKRQLGENVPPIVERRKEAMAWSNIVRRYGQKPGYKPLNIRAKDLQVEIPFRL